MPPRLVFWVIFITIFTAFFGTLFLFSASAVVYGATPPAIISYQGKLLQNGASVTTTQNMGFLIFDAVTGGNLLYTAAGTLAATTTMSITPSSGIFSVDLGATGTNTLPTSTFANNHTLYLEVHVGSTTLTPRKRLTAVPFALNSQYLMGLSATSTSGTNYIPHADDFGNFLFTGNPRSDNVNGGIIYLNPSSTPNNATLFGVAINGSERFRVDEDGDVFASGTATIAGVSTTAGVYPNSNNAYDLGGFASAWNEIFSSGTSYLGAVITDGNMTIGSTTSHTITLNARFASNLIPSTDNARDLGIFGNAFNEIYASGTAFLAGVSSTSGLYPTANNSYDLGNNGLAWRNIFASGTVAAATLGINSTTPFTTFGVSGTSYLAGTTTIDSSAVIRGNMTKPTHVGSIANGGSVPLQGPVQLFVIGDYVYQTAYTSDAVTIIDVSNPPQPSYVGSVTDSTRLDGAGSIYVQGNYAYVLANVGDRLTILDISDPASPFIVSSLADGGGSAPFLDAPSQVTVLGNYAYIAVTASDALEIVDVSDPRNPTHAGALRNGGGSAPFLDGATVVVVDGDYAYVGSNVSNRIQVVDVSDRANPVAVSSLADGGVGTVPHLTNPQSILLKGNYAYVAANDDNAVEIIDIGNPNSLTHAGAIVSGGNALLGGPRVAFPLGDYLYVTAEDSNAFTIIDISSSTNPVHVSSIVDGGVGVAPHLSGALGVFVKGNYAYVGSFSDDDLEIIDIGAATISNAKIGNADVGLLQVSNLAFFNGPVSVKGGLSVGNSGLLVNGDFAMVAPTSSPTMLNATNTLSFSNRALFRASSTNGYNFIFDTINTLASSTNNYIFSVRNNGTRMFSISANGDTKIDGGIFASSTTIGTPGSPGDLAEQVDIAADDMVEPGDVVIIDSRLSDTYRRSNGAYDSRVAGVISGNPTIVVGYGKTRNTAPMAIVGRVPVNVSSENGPVQRGDLLVSASQPGRAMRYDPTLLGRNTPVAIIGMALEEFASGASASTTGKIMSLIRTGWITSQHQTITQIQNDLQIVAQARGVALSPRPAAPLTVRQNDVGQIVSAQASDLNLGGYAILNVARLVGASNKWAIDAHGRFVTQVETRQGARSLYSVQASALELITRGSDQLQTGQKQVGFEPVTADLIDLNQPMNVLVTLTGDAKGLYVSEKSATGFTVREVQGGVSNAPFDWVVMASRRVESASAPPPTASSQLPTPVTSQTMGTASSSLSSAPLLSPGAGTAVSAVSTTSATIPNQTAVKKK